ncbi:cell migration-inducing and hyaluronan-binding protein [Mytilus galloprovincialis]|uniref:Cell migration-inducing and hyaluronan-binding protein n=1 Tax=Mytilus galloprovincialis TaxID=29158 RepID=A0A8B6DSX3_MYTGA|nr:cell migration-inducing and hyaluronan-binding protein [Mytilus galloprovincialis]
MCHDTDEENYPHPPYVRRNSIHHFFARCVTVHGSHGVKVQDNVCYDHLCHGIFLEDGGEKRTVIDGNLVAVTRKCKLIHSDGNPASYWITNPQTIIRNNVAAGSEGMGFWIIFPDKPTGPSESLGFMAFDEANHTKITEMSNNAAHSNNHGLFIDNRIKKIGNELKVEGTNGYYPRTMPLDPKNSLAEDDPVYIDYQTCWKNRENAWIRGGLIFVRWFSSSDQEQFIEKSVFIGETDNIGEPTEVWSSTLNRLLGYPRYLVIPWDDKYPIQGFIFYDGPVYAESIWFDKFTLTTNYTSGALTFLRNNLFSSSSVSHVMDIKYGFVDPTGGNCVYDGDVTVHGFSNLDGDKSATCRDQDGSVTNLTSIQQIVKPGRFYTTASCQYRSTWKMAMCPHKYAKLDVNIDNGSPDRGQTNSIMVRDDEPNSPETLTDDQTAQFMAILGGISLSELVCVCRLMPISISIPGLHSGDQKQVIGQKCPQLPILTRIPMETDISGIAQIGPPIFHIATL